MILRVAGRTRCGAVVDLRDEAVEESAVVAAVRGTDSPYGAHCGAPTAVHERAGHVRPNLALETRTALAAAGRSLDRSTPHDEELAAVREQLASVDVPDDPPRPPSVAPEEDPERLRERVAELRGRVQAFEACGRDADEERATLRDAARRLSELETERMAASEIRSFAREHRDRRDRRLRLEDREANLAREARAHLVDRLRDPFADAVDALAPAVDDPFEADPVTAALAVLRVARVRTPVVLAVDRFDHPAAAARWLDAPVVRL